MKKAEEYVKTYKFYPDIPIEVVRDFIKQAQIDAIDATVKFCAENTKLQKASDYGYFYEESAKFNDSDCNIIVNTQYGHGDCGYEAVRISKQSILNCADILKKEIE